MKRFLFFIILMIAYLPAHADTSDINSLFESYAAVTGYKTVILNSRLLQTFKTEDSEIIDKIDQIRILSSLKPDEDLFHKAQSAANTGYEQVSVNLDGELFTGFYIHDSDRGKKSFLMIARRSGQEIIMEISGKFSIKDISKLSNLGI